MIGKGNDWRDKTHFRLNLGFAWADWLFFAPLFVSGCVGVLLGQPWGYVLFGAAGARVLYINIILWFTEKEHAFVGSTFFLQTNGQEWAVTLEATPSTTRHIGSTTPSSPAR